MQSLEPQTVTRSSAGRLMAPRLQTSVASLRRKARTASIEFSFQSLGRPASGRQIHKMYLEFVVGRSTDADRCLAVMAHEYPPNTIGVSRTSLYCRIVAIPPESIAVLERSCEILLWLTAPKNLDSESTAHWPGADHGTLRLVRRTATTYCERHRIFRGCVGHVWWSKPLRHETTYIEKVAAGNIADGQLLNKAFQRLASHL